jgi:hypothetical protein
MKTGPVPLLRATLLAACLLAAWPRPAAAFLDFRPPTLGNLCSQATHIYVLRVDKVSPEHGVILFKSVAELKATGKWPLPDGALTKQVIRPNVEGARIILDWAAEGKTAVLFAKDYGVKTHAHVYIDGYWYMVAYDVNGNCLAAVNGQPVMLTRYCGSTDQLADAVTKILRGEEVVVPAMVGANTQDLEQRRGKVRDLTASLRILGDTKKTALEDMQLEGKKPEAGEKKPDAPQPAVVGTVKALSADGKTLTLQPLPTEKNKEPTTIEVRIGESTKIIPGKEGGKLAVGQTASVWLAKGEGGSAAAIQIGKPTENPEKKPEKAAPALVGTVKALAADGKSFTVLAVPTEKGKEPTTIEVRISERTTITNGKEAVKLTVGQIVNVWLEKGDGKVATEIRVGKLPEPPEKKPAPPDKGKTLPPEKPDEPFIPKEPARPARDPAPTAALIDAEAERYLAKYKLPTSPQADDAEFVRRVHLDLTGRIPTYQRTIHFLDSKDPEKRRKLIDELLESPAYGEHMATVWRNRLVPRNVIVGEKQRGDSFTPWLAGQFNDNRGWNAIVSDLLTAEGTPTDNPATTFLLANGDNNQPQPNRAAGAAAALFWGVNLRCAECHNHPFARWKQTDFWGTAAFFGKVRYGGAKMGPMSLTESLTVAAPTGKEKGQPALPTVRGAAIVIPPGSGKAAGQVVKARFLGGDEPTLEENEPFRPRFAAWATSADNPYFARAAVNRQWAHFYGRGFVNPMDSFDINDPAHPELLNRLAKEFTDSGFDLKHLARCICNSKAYQRSSRPLPGNEGDASAFSHMAVKVLTPEAFFDSTTIVLRGATDKQDTRDQFVRTFRFDEETDATEYAQGIPQALRLMNGPMLNRGAPVVEQLARSGTSRTEAITTLYLTVLSRRPTAEEVELISGYLSRRKDDREGYRGVLWILLNSSEFALNH